MKTRLIKLNKEHYIIVDDSAIKEGDMFINEHNQISVCVKSLEEFLKNNTTNTIKKVTHSTKPLEYHQVDVKLIDEGVEGWEFNKIKQLSLSEVEELLFGYSVQKLVNESFENMGYNSTVTPYEEDQFKLGYKLGFNAHKELAKDKLFTVDDMLMVFKHGILFNQETVSNCKEAVETEFDLLIKSIKPKTEWEVKFINEKLTLKQ